MLTSKDRAKLRSIMSTETSIYQIGKEGLSSQNVEGINQALTARELVKITILQNCDDSAKDLANDLAKLLNCEVVGVIGRKVILYRVNPKNKKHVL